MWYFSEYLGVTVCMSLRQGSMPALVMMEPPVRQCPYELQSISTSLPPRRNTSCNSTTGDERCGFHVSE